MNRKGVMGLNLVKAFMLLLLAIAVIGFIGVIIMSNLDTASESVMPQKSATLTNETVSAVDNAGDRLSYASRVNAKCTILGCTNATTEEAIPATNISESEECTIYNVDTDSVYYNIDWNCTYSVTYIEDDATTILRNTSSGIAEFFDDSGTWLTLLSVVVIILIIAVVIMAVNRFGGRGAGVGGVVSGGSRSRVDSTEL